MKAGDDVLSRKILRGNLAKQDLFRIHATAGGHSAEDGRKTELRGSIQVRMKHGATPSQRLATPCWPSFVEISRHRSRRIWPHLLWLHLVSPAAWPWKCGVELDITPTGTFSLTLMQVLGHRDHVQEVDRYREGRKRCFLYSVRSTV